jgi:Viral BACON domain/Putative binding domain, N-terminal
LPPEVTNWTVSCSSRNGATCPSTADLNLLREGQAITTWPAGGTLSFLATGTAPQVATGSNATLKFAAAVANASGSPDSNPSNDTPPLAQTVVNAPAVCNTVANPSALQLGSAAQAPHVNLIVGTGCTWSAQSSVPWLTVSPASGTGDTTLTLTVAANTTASELSGSVTVNDQRIVVTQSGITSNPCATLQLGREGDQIAPNGLTGGTSFGVTADSQCSWQAYSNANWITLTAGRGGTANGIVTYLVEPNASPQPRNGTITVGPKTFTVDQLGVTGTGDSSPGGGGGGADGGGDGA